MQNTKIDFGILRKSFLPGILSLQIITLLIIELEPGTVGTWEYTLNGLTISAYLAHQ